jgi:hypothetical protein
LGILKLLKNELSEICANFKISENRRVLELKKIKTFLKFENTLKRENKFRYYQLTLKTSKLRGAILCSYGYEVG